MAGIQRREGEPSQSRAETSAVFCLQLTAVVSRKQPSESDSDSMCRCTDKVHFGLALTTPEDSAGAEANLTSHLSSVADVLDLDSYQVRSSI